MSISDDNTSTLSNTDRTDRLQPVFTDGIPIIWDGIDAHLAGILLEVKRFFIRTGQFKNLFAFRAAPVGGKGMLAVSSFSSVPFVLGSLVGPLAYDFDTPSPPGAQRFADYRHERMGPSGGSPGRPRGRPVTRPGDDRWLPGTAGARGRCASVTLRRDTTDLTKFGAAGGQADGSPIMSFKIGKH